MKHTDQPVLPAEDVVTLLDRFRIASLLLKDAEAQRDKALMEFQSARDAYIQVLAMNRTSARNDGADAPDGAI